MSEGKSKGAPLTKEQVEKAQKEMEDDLKVNYGEILEMETVLKSQMDDLRGKMKETRKRLDILEDVKKRYHEVFENE